MVVCFIEIIFLYLKNILNSFCFNFEILYLIFLKRKIFFKYFWCEKVFCLFIFYDLFLFNVFIKMILLLGCNGIRFYIKFLEIEYVNVSILDL